MWMPRIKMRNQRSQPRLPQKERQIGRDQQAAAGVDPLSPQNPLIFSAGPFAGSSFSNANRTSVGCKSPLTGGIKEANAGGQAGEYFYSDWFQQ